LGSLYTSSTFIKNQNNVKKKKENALPTGMEMVTKVIMVRQHKYDILLMCWSIVSFLFNKTKMQYVI